MAKVPLLTESELDLALVRLPGWTVSHGKLHREYVFPDFVHAFGFMATSAIAIEAMNHHPEWWNCWNRVIVDLATHDSGGITGKDLELAGKLDVFAGKLR